MPETPRTRRDLLKLGAGTAALAWSEPSGGRETYLVFSKGRIANLTLKNRLVRAAAAEGAFPNGEMVEGGIELYRGLARGGVGLIVTGHMAVMAAGRSEGSQTCIYEDRFTNAIRKIAETAHANGAGCKIFSQLNHAGMQGRLFEPVGPSSTVWPNRRNKPRPLTTLEVEEIVTHYAEAARRAREAGFDGVELHAAHGYLLHSFLSPFTNSRTDKYGGSIGKRVTVIREIVEQTRARVGPDFPVIVKTNADDGVPGGTNIDSFPALARAIEEAGAQALEVSSFNPSRSPDGADGQSYFLKYARKLDLNIPLILTGGNRSVDRLEAILKSEKPQFFGIARPLFREPDLPSRWRQGRGGPESACISCNRCLKALGNGEVTRCRVNDPA